MYMYVHVHVCGQMLPPLVELTQLLLEEKCLGLILNKRPCGLSGTISRGSAAVSKGVERPASNR